MKIFTVLFLTLLSSSLIAQERQSDKPLRDPTMPDSSYFQSQEREGEAAPAAKHENLVIPKGKNEAGEMELAKVDLRDIFLAEACRLLAEPTQWNLVPSAQASTKKISLFLQNVETLAAIDALCKANQLWFQRETKSQIVRIYTVEEYKTVLDSAKVDKIEIFTLLYPNVIDVAYAVRDSFGDRVALRLGGDDWDSIQDLQQRFWRFDVMDSRTQGFGNSSQNSNSQFGFGSNNNLDSNLVTGSQSMWNRSSNNSLQNNGFIGSDSLSPSSPGTSNLTQNEIQRLANLSSQQEQTTRSPEPSDINVTVMRRHNKLLVRTGDERAMEQIRNLVSKLDIPTPLVLLEVKILSVELLDGFSSFFEYQGANRKIAGSFTTGDIQNPPPPDLGPAGTGLRSGELIFQYVNDNFAMRMQLLEEKDRISMLAAPLLLTANNEVSRLFVGREVPLNRGFSSPQTLVNESTTTTTAGSTQIEFRPVGTTLLITPNINSDRTVTLRIVQESSDINSTAPVLIPTRDGFTRENVSVVSSQTVSGTIVAKSELSIAFGGLIEKSTVRENQKVPVLGDIPGLGYLFRREIERDTRNELVVVVRPYILNTPAESESWSTKALEGTGAKIGIDGFEEKSK